MLWDYFPELYPSILNAWDYTVLQYQEIPLWFWWIVGILAAFSLGYYLNYLGDSTLKKRVRARLSKGHGEPMKLDNLNPEPRTKPSKNRLSRIIRKRSEKNEHKRMHTL